MGRRLSIALLALVGACIAAPDEGPKMCEVQADCRAGTTCLDNYCYGDPPRTITLAGLLQTTDGTAKTELPALEISEEGEITNVRFAPMIRLSGRITFSTLPLDGSVVFTRRSAIVGLPEISVTVEVNTERDPDFEVPLLPGETYEVKIEPGDEPLGPEMPRASEVAPARYFTYTAPTVDTQIEWSLEPDAGLRAITGLVQDSTGQSVAGARVRALGDIAVRGVEDRPSTVAVTDAEGSFTVFASRELDPVFDLEVTVETAPSAKLVLIRSGVEVVDYPGTPVPYDTRETRLPPHPAVAMFTFPVEGSATYGGSTRVMGADVLMRTWLEEAPNRVLYEASATTDQEGNAALALVPTRSYVVSVTPQPESEHGVLIDHVVETGGGGVNAPIVLPARITVAGSIVDAEQNLVPGLKVEARLSFPFLMTLEGTQRATAEQLVWRATESEEGFLIPLDGELFGQVPRYDIVVTPPEGSWLPAWQFDQIVDFVRDVPTTNSVTLAPRTLPLSSIARTVATDQDEHPVAGASLEVFALPDVSICQAYQGECRPKPRSLALGKADDHGVIDRLVLPNPDAP